MEPGRTLSHYRLIEKIGEGGMGVVYAAEDTRLRRRVALKVLPGDFAGDAERRSRFEREARAAATLNHPNIVTLFSVEEDRGLRFITMELVEGRTLAELVRPGGLDLEALLRLAIPLADALAAAHRAGITHRDLKPQNVMVTAEGRVKVLDFGLAKWSTQAGATPDETTASMSQGRIVGTMPYMSPEQVRGEPVDHRSDIFSLGVVLYELATGRRPFEGDTAAELVSSILRDTATPLTDLNRRMPSRLASIIDRALDKDPMLRLQSAADLRDDLDRLRTEPGATGERFGSSVAVLPFTDMSAAKDQEYFCEGMAEEIINALAALEGLRVASRMSSFQFNATAGDVREIGRRLGVTSVVEGSVRRSGDRLRITAQLIDATSGYHLWSERYDRGIEDVFSIQDEIAASVVRALRPTLRQDETLVRRQERAASVEAYDFYLRGRHYAGQRTARSAGFALEMYARAIEIDPEYALAHAGLADCYSILFDERGGRAQDLADADAASRKAIELGPDRAECHAARGLSLSQAGRLEDAESEYKASIRLNPRLFEAYYYYARDCMLKRRLDEAIELFAKAASIRSDDYQALGMLSVLFRRLGREDDALLASRRQLAVVERRLDLHPDDVRARILGASALLSLGDRERSLDWTARALSLDPDGSDTAYNAACVYARAGMAGEALKILETKVRPGLSGADREWFAADPDLDSLRAEARFRKLLED